mgnify:CR=1 FL=1
MEISSIFMTLQRRNQKVIEFAPAWSISEETRKKILDSAKRLARRVGYTNAGTMEFLVDEEEHPYFIEMNPRIQVEHTVTEMVTGIDLSDFNCRRVSVKFPNDSHLFTK